MVEKWFMQGSDYCSDTGDSGGKKVYRMGCRPGISTSFGQLDQHVPVCITQTFRYHMEHWKKKRKAGDHKERKTSN